MLFSYKSKEACHLQQHRWPCEYYAKSSKSDKWYINIFIVRSIIIKLVKAEIRMMVVKSCEIEKNGKLLFKVYKHSFISLISSGT